MDSGVGSPAVVASYSLTPAVAGEVVRYGSAPYRYFLANSTTPGDYEEISAWPIAHLSIEAPATPFSLTSWNRSIGSGGRSVVWTEAFAAAFMVPIASSSIGDQWFVTQFGAGQITITGGSGNRTVVGNPKTGGQNQSIHVRVLDNGNILVTGGVA